MKDIIVQIRSVSLQPLELFIQFLQFCSCILYNRTRSDGGVGGSTAGIAPLSHWLVASSGLLLLLLLCMQEWGHGVQLITSKLRGSGEAGIEKKGQLQL